jgi:Tfp pilus assembly protein PilF
VLWADGYDAAATDLLAVEDTIVAAVARTIRPRQTFQADGDGGVVTRAGRVDPLAHDHYLRGEYALKQRSPASVVEAISEYRAAASLDANYTAALAREAYAYAVFLDWGWTYPGLPADELLGRGLELSERALRQDSLSAEAWLARAYLLQLQDPGRLSGATDAFGRAVALDPTNPEAQHQYGQALMAVGRYAEAKTAYHAALAVEPERPLTLVPLAAIALRERDAGAARRWADSAVVLASQAPYPWASRAQLRLALGDPAGARTDAERALEIDPSYELPGQAALAAALAALGEPSAAEEALSRARRAMVRPDRPSTTEALYLANALVHMGRLDEALTVLESARPRGGYLWFYFQSPTFDTIRGDERFRRVMESADPRLAG